MNGGREIRQKFFLERNKTKVALIEMKGRKEAGLKFLLKK